ncbi:toxin-activating lysine-acyltransferase [Photorhabdus asymbiotica]|uniref:toxin-activating lysine-acyltransferase n=1 Tax=Photorhabdus asymbiotica TaxID=291112 RepID=UPI003DA74450
MDLRSDRPKQFKILFDYLDRPLGYITWAYLREDTLHRLIHDPHYFLHISEWNEGGIMCILDFCCRPSSAVYCLDYFKGVTPFANVEKMVWQSKRSGRLMTRKNRMQRK